jgi:hypothetical protein
MFATGFWAGMIFCQAPAHLGNFPEWNFLLNHKTYGCGHANWVYLGCLLTLVL